jgi:hypothetical protein
MVLLSNNAHDRRVDNFGFRPAYFSHSLLVVVILFFAMVSDCCKILDSALAHGPRDGG